MRHSYEDARPSHEPRTDHALTLRDGRRVQVAEWGPPDCVPVMFFHGTPGSRLLCPDLAATERAGVRHLSFDRPGYGRSDPFAGVAGYTEAARLVVEMLDLLRVERAGLVGWSGGGPYALACGAYAPERVSAIATVCANGRPATADELAAEPDDVRELLTRAREDPIGARELVRERCAWLADDPRRLLRQSERFDAAMFDAPGLRETFAAWMDEAGVLSIDGYVDDWLVTFASADWGFDLADVAVPVFSWYGERDPLVESFHAAYQRDHIPDCQTFGCPECWHFVLVAHWPEILAQVSGAHMTM